MERSIADIIAEHEPAHARTNALEDRPSVSSLREEWRQELALLDAEAAQDDLMFELVNAACASDDEFFIKAAYILKYELGVDDDEHIRLVEALRQHLKRRERHAGP